VKRKLCSILLFITVLTVSCSTAAYADVSYECYNYDYWGNVVPSPVSYTPERTVSGADLGISDFNTPSDMAFDGEGNLYVADTGNSRIVVLNRDLTLKKVITQFGNKGKKDTFKKPEGITVGSDGTIHIADTENHRIVSMNSSGKLIRVFGLTKNSLTGSNFVFLPTKVGVDRANRYYVIASHVTNGIMGFDANGEFSGYFGSLKVQTSLAEKFWKTVATKEQRSQMELFIPTEFNNLDIDSDGFVYATDTDDSEDQSIRKINPSGVDVLVNYNSTKPICGDLSYNSAGSYSGPSKFVDIIVRKKGIYSALDSTRGRIFTYDSEGNLLYVFGGLGSQLGTFKNPIAIGSWNEGIYILDQNRAQIIVFQPTQYGQLINKAVGLRFDGDETKAVSCWKNVLKLDSHYELAYDGIGKSLLASNKNKEAMYYLKKGMDKRNYSIAFHRYRNEWMRKYGSIVAIILLGIIVFFAGRSFYRRRKFNRGE